MKDFKLNLVKANELDPTKKYLIEADRHFYTMEDLHTLIKKLDKMGVEAVVVVSNGGDGLKIKELPLAKK